MEEKKKYFSQFVVSIATLMATFILYILLAATLPLPVYSPWRPVLASIPMVFPALFVGFAIARVIALAINDMDELQQRIHLEAFALSLASTATLSFAFGLVEALSEININYIFIPLLVIAFWGIGFVRAKRRYQ